MDSNYSRQYSVFGGSIGPTVAVPISGTAAGSLGFTQAAIDDADAIFISVQTAAINIRFDGTVATAGSAGGHYVANNTSLFLRGQNIISKLSFIANGATSGWVNVTIFGGK